MPASNSDPSEKGLKLSRFQKFTIERWPRSRIKNAPYNPRVISPSAKKKLQANISKVGLIEPVIVNRTTCNLVGGHKRLASLDVLQGKGDYLLDVSVVVLTEKQEKEQNIFLNYGGAQGEWDVQALAEMLPDLDIEATGFDDLELETVLGESGSGLFGADEQNEETNAVVGDIGELLQARAEKKEEAKAAKGRREKMRDTTKAERQEEDTERVAYVICKDRKDRERFVEGLGLDVKQRYVPVALLRKKR